MSTLSHFISLYVQRERDCVYVNNEAEAIHKSSLTHAHTVRPRRASVWVSKNVVRKCESCTTHTHPLFAQTFCRLFNLTFCGISVFLLKVCLPLSPLCVDVCVHVFVGIWHSCFRIQRNADVCNCACVRVCVLMLCVHIKSTRQRV